MLKNYLAILLRGFRKTPIYSLLNVSGLAMGIACAALILLWIEDEVSYDHQYAKRDQIYSIMMNLDYSGKVETVLSIPWRMANELKGTIPEVLHVARFGWSHELFGLAEKTTYENGIYADSSFLSIIPQVFTAGNAAAFSNPHTILLTEKMAQKFFGDSDPIGKTLRVDNEKEYTVIGVIKDVPSNSSIQYSWIAPVQNFYEKNTWLDPWPGYGIRTLVELQKDANIDKLNKQITAIIRPKHPVYAKAELMLWSMTNWHLHDGFTNGKPDGGRITFINIIAAIGWIILVIACINFMNMATARAGQRAREVGVRKTLGAMRGSLIGQFIFESFLMSYLAVILAVLLVYLALPGFNILTDKQLVFEPFKPQHLVALISIGAFCGLIAGSYPAFYLSAFDPVAVLKGQKIGTGTGSAGFIRKALVIIQFTFSVGLIVCTVIINEQVQYVRSRDLGYNKEHLVYMSIQGNLASHFDAIKTDLLQTGVVENAALSSSPPLDIWSITNSERVTWPGASLDKKVKISWGTVTPEYFSTMGLQMREGQVFSPVLDADTADIIINETLAGIMGKNGHPGGIMNFAHQYQFRIVGIVKDYLFNDMRGAVAPLMLTCEKIKADNYAFLAIRLKANNNLQTSLKKMEDVIRTDNPGYPVDYGFVDKNFEQQFTVETRIGQFAGLFSMLAILISCLGLFGLAAYTTERRTKEIGIRKVLGASTGALASLLAKEFLQLVSLACVIAFPLAWLCMNRWLDDYSYRATIHWWVFAGTGLAAFLIAMLTVSFLAIRTARANPVKSLRTE